MSLESLSIVGIIAVFASGKYELAVINEKIFSRRIALVFSAILFSIIVLFVFSVLWYLFHYYYDINIFTNPKNTFFILVIGIFLTILHDCFVNLNIAKNKVRPISISKFIRVLGLSTTQIFLSFINLHQIGLLIGEIIGRFSGFIVLAKGNISNFSRINYKRFIRYTLLVAKKYASYPKKTAPSWTLNNSITLLMPIFLSIEFGLAVSGGYFIMYKVFSIPEIAIVQSLNQSFMIEFSLSKDNPKKTVINFY